MLVFFISVAFTLFLTKLLMAFPVQLKDDFEQLWTESLIMSFLKVVTLLYQLASDFTKMGIEDVFSNIAINDFFQNTNNNKHLPLVLA